MRLSEMKPRLLQDFLLPHLDRGTFEEKLCWVNRDARIFKIFWRHQSSSRFRDEDSCVFRSWAEAKGLWDPKNKRSLTTAKQRLRAALLKLRSVTFLRKEGESRVYKIVSPSESQYESDYCSSDSSQSFENTFQEYSPPNYEYMESDNFMEQILQMPNLIEDMHMWNYEEF